MLFGWCSPWVPAGTRCGGHTAQQEAPGAEGCRGCERVDGAGVAASVDAAVSRLPRRKESRLLCWGFGTRILVFIFTLI